MADTTRHREPLREAERILLEEARAEYLRALGPAHARLEAKFGAVLRDHSAAAGASIEEDADGRPIAVLWPEVRPTATPPNAPPQVGP